MPLRPLPLVPPKQVGGTGTVYPPPHLGVLAKNPLPQLPRQRWGATSPRHDSPSKVNFSRCSSAFINNWTNREEAICEHEKAALERDATACVQNHLLIQIEILRRSQTSENPEAEGFRASLPPPLSTGTALRVNKSATGHSPRVTLGPQSPENSQSGRHRGGRSKADRKGQSTSPFLKETDLWVDYPQLSSLRGDHFS